MNEELEKKLEVLVMHAWDQEIRQPEINAWSQNFDGRYCDSSLERRYSLFMLTKFIYFSKRLVREMLKSLYRDQFQGPLRRRLRKNLNNTRDSALIDRLYFDELNSTRFIGVGNPSESGAHLLYYFRQVNHLSKELFSDINSSFKTIVDRTGKITLVPHHERVKRYIFFDDLVGTAEQSSVYLSKTLKQIRDGSSDVDIRFMCLFSKTEGLKKLNQPNLFDGKATSLFELDKTFSAFDDDSRYFADAPGWFDKEHAKEFAIEYGRPLFRPPLGHGDGQLLLGFSHNTPDNSLPIFWKEGSVAIPWSPIFLRYDKVY
jgi:hypothetical protein